MMQATIFLALVAVLTVSGQDTTTPVPDPCSEPLKSGPCNSRRRRYYYDKDTKQCEEFGWGGCEANGNNFEDMIHCEMACIRKLKLCPDVNVGTPSSGAVTCPYFTLDCFIDDPASRPCPEGQVCCPQPCGTSCI